MRYLGVDEGMHCLRMVIRNSDADAKIEEEGDAEEAEATETTNVRFRSEYVRIVRAYLGEVDQERLDKALETHRQYLLRRGRFTNEAIPSSAEALFLSRFDSPPEED